MRNESWRKGAVSFSYEPLLPEFDIPDLWHNSFSAYIQLPDNYGGIAISNNFIFMGKNTFFDPFERSLDKEISSYETVLTVGYGCTISSSSLYSHYFGCGLDFIHSALAPGTGSPGEGTATSFAVDIGYIGRFSNGIRFGVNFTNMGPALFYSDLSQMDPIPFTFNAAVAYTRNVVVNDFDLLRFSSELRVDKELVINHFDGDPEPFYTALFVDPFNEPASYEFREFNYHAGYEFVFANTFALRQGVLIDPLGVRYESHYGFGLSIYNHLHVDYSYIWAPEYYMDNLDHVITGHKH